ncbi:keratin, type I cytoskeletal 9-like [Panicum virgatum]|uniref:keratin, type I cytoskeletal 9-like n=1 Tax=Panicum virgatum TaxID=38727 RepID=UPI0019D64772|nr:keratin, type I cytoskeletal 9-like [Panicum virgatum]
MRVATSSPSWFCRDILPVFFLGLGPRGGREVVAAATAARSHGLPVEEEGRAALWMLSQVKESGEEREEGNERGHGEEVVGSAPACHRPSLPEDKRRKGARRTRGRGGRGRLGGGSPAAASGGATPMAGDAREHVTGGGGEVEGGSVEGAQLLPAGHDGGRRERPDRGLVGRGGGQGGMVAEAQQWRHGGPELGGSGGEGGCGVGG